MSDIFTPEKRSWVMSRIKGKWTVPEKIIHNHLKGGKIRHKMHPKMPGNPDILIENSRLVIFIDGEFWHGRDYQKRKHKLTPFWKEKINENMKRDRKHRNMLKGDGWEVLRLWERDIRKRPEWCVEKIKGFKSVLT